MTIKKTVSPRGLPLVHPGLAQRLREAEEAERQGKTPRALDGPQKIIRPSLDAMGEERAWQARTIGLVDPAYRVGMDRVSPLADQEAFRPGEDLDQIWDQLSESEKIRAGATERFRLELEATLRRAGKAWQPPHKITGRLDARNLRRSRGNVLAEVAALDDVLAPDSRLLLERFIEDTHALVELCLRVRAIKGLDGAAMYELLHDLARKLIYQELASRRRGMGDRGIRRICGNIELAETVYAQLTRLPGYSPRERLMMRIIHVHQDLGYTAYAARTSWRGGRLHRAYGARIFTDEMNRYRTLLTPEELETVRSSVATHSAEELPFVEDRVMALVRAVDHLAPFAPYRLLEHLEHLPGASDYLDDLLAHARKGDAARFAAARAAFRRFLAEGSDLPAALRDDIIAAFRAFDRGAELIDLGPLAGQVQALELDPRPPGGLFATIEPRAFTARYQALFDVQQDQLLRLARATGVSLAAAAQGPLRFAAQERGLLQVQLGSTIS